jgi:hypothetical protein
VGYRPKRDPYKLNFSATEHEGLEVTVRRMPVSVLLDVAAGMGAPNNADALRHLYATLAFALESWNVEDDEGQPVPADLDGVVSQDPEFMSVIIQAWFARMLRQPGGEAT